MLRTLTLLLVLATVPPSSTPAAPSEYREDLRLLRSELARIHPRPFHHVAAAEFDGALARLDRELPQLTRDGFLARLAGLMAMLGQGDGHSGVNLGHPSVKAGFIPIGFYAFSDGVFVKSAAKEHSGVLRARLLAVNGTPAEEVVRRAAGITEGDNAMTRKAWAVRVLSIPELLRGLGVAGAGEPIEYALRKEDGSEVRLRPEAIGFRDRVEWIDATPATRSPLYLRHASPHPYVSHMVSKNFWYEYDGTRKLLYVNYSAVADAPDESVAEFFRRVFAFAAAKPVERFVLDIRNNGGGNNFLNRPILHGMIKRDDTIGREGKFFVIIGRNTFSAAQNLATLLDAHTAAIFVGEPTGGSPNHYGDPTQIILPRSGIPVRIATLWWQDAHPADARPWIAPDVAAELASSDYFNGRDPALDAILGYAAREPVTEQLLRRVASGGTGEGVALVRRFLAEPANRYANLEAAINNLGYRVLREKPEEAVKIFEVNTVVYPDSWNVWDSLGEALAATGNKARAIEAYERALRMNPDANSARRQLQRLRGE